MTGRRSCPVRTYRVLCVIGAGGPGLGMCCVLLPVNLSRAPWKRRVHQTGAAVGVFNVGSGLGGGVGAGVVFRPP